MLNKKVQLYILSGPPASGKSTWAKNFVKENVDTVIISRDSIRFSLLNEGEDYFSKEPLVEAMFYQEVSLALSHGYNVIADATHNTARARNYAITQMTNNFIEKFFDINVVEFNIPVNILLERNSKRIGKAKVPNEVIKNMAKRHMKVSNGEQYYYNKIIEVNE